jgi:hypothetical protein
MYYLLETDYFQKPEPFRTRCVTEAFKYQPSRWITGRMMQTPPEPMKVEFWVRGGDGLAELFLDSIPLFRDDLLAALQEAGVDNLQMCDVSLTSLEGRMVPGYHAVNVVGLVAAADLSKSHYTDTTGTGVIAVGFRKLVVDERAAANLLLFRLAESIASIVVHERVKAALDRRPFRYLGWRKLEASHRGSS